MMKLHKYLRCTVYAGKKQDFQLKKSEKGFKNKRQLIDPVPWCPRVADALGLCPRNPAVLLSLSLSWGTVAHILP